MWQILSIKLYKKQLDGTKKIPKPELVRTVSENAESATPTSSEPLRSLLQVRGGMLCGLGLGCDVVWSGMVWCGVVWSGAVRYGMVWYGLVWCMVWSGMVYGMVWSGMVYGLVWYGVWYGLVWCMVWYGMVW